MQSIVDKLLAVLGERCIITEPRELEPFSTDWRGRYSGTPLCVILPHTVEQVSQVLALCAAENVSIVPQGGNTGLTGASVPKGTDSVILSLTRMNRVLDVDQIDGTMTVEAGCVLATIQAKAAEAGWRFPLTLGAEGSCQIGGNISTNAGGTGVVRYGNTRDLVMGLEVVLPSGEIWNGLNALRKNNSGYDLKQLFIGAEGTLGIITKATLRLFPQPRDNSSAWLALKSSRHAVELATRARQELDTAISAIEMMNLLQAQLVQKHVHNARLPIQEEYPFYIMIEVSSMKQDGSARASLEAFLGQCLEDELIADAVMAESLSQSESFWYIRHGVAEANRAEGMGITMDLSVPTSAIDSFLVAAEDIVALEFPEARPVIVSHLGDGNIHYIVMVAAGRWSGIEDKPAYTRTVRQRLNDLAVKQYRGSFSAEHGVGQTLLPEVERYKSATEMKLLQGIKKLIDPNNLMNPGKLLPPL